MNSCLFPITCNHLVFLVDENADIETPPLPHDKLLLIPSQLTSISTPRGVPHAAQH
jgi:hypothetical protein